MTTATDVSATSTRWESVLSGSDDDGQGPLRLPAPPSPPRRGGIPLLASIVPVVGAGGLWLVTGTTTMLWFAALGPLIAGASLLDAARTGRRDRRRYERDAGRARRRLRTAVGQRHTAERARLWARHPDVARLVEASSDDVWRRVGPREQTLVLAHGAVRSAVRVEGGDESEQTRLLRREAGVLQDAPVTVDLRAGVAVIGPAGLAAAVVRALVGQLCLTHPPGRLHLVDDGSRTGGDDADWLDELPHTRPGGTDAVTLGVAEPGRPVTGSCDVLIARAHSGAVPPACAAVLSLTGIDTARLEHEGTVRDVQVEALSHGQAVHLAAELAARATRTFGQGGTDPAVSLADLIEHDGSGGPGLAAVVGTERGRPAYLDLVADGPHALVAGMTGAGKSELLTTWVASMCAAHTPDEVVFLLADFKGGTAFDPLAPLPHVTGIITDLDSGGARRALESLRAEIRRREAAMVAARSREISGTGMPRLVIVVDEFAALAAMHPELQDLFTDVAARGRALGMHLVLGTQRAAGVFRDALTANAPLRISLRVTDAADSRALIGSGRAADLPADAESRGIALVRRAADAAAGTVRVALCPPALIDQIVARGWERPVRSPWLPELDECIPLTPLRRDRAGTLGPDSGEVVLGVADEPEHQRRRGVALAGHERGLCVVGTSGSGRTGALRAVAAQCPKAVRVGPDLEQAWDALCALDEQLPGAGTMILIDDLDALLARMPADYAQSAVEMTERIIHGCGSGAGRVVVSVQRVNGPVSRLVDLIPRRALLAQASRADLVVAGGAPADMPERMPPGRAVLDGRVMQFAFVADDEARVGERAPSVPPWCPQEEVTAVIARGQAVLRTLGAYARDRGAQVLDLEQADVSGARPPAPGTVVLGDPDRWQRAYGLLQRLRGEHDVLIDAGCGPEYRLLTGDRTPPPLCLPGRGRAWLVHRGAEPVRVQAVRPRAS